jgi:hypothetical protein
MPRPGWCGWSGHRWFSEPAIDLDCHRELAAGFNRPTKSRDLSQLLPVLGAPASAIRPTSSLKVNRAANEHLTPMRSTSVHLGPVSSKTR